MKEENEDALKHLARHVILEGMKSSGCMVTLLAMLTGIGSLSAIVVLFFIV